MAMTLAAFKQLTECPRSLPEPLQALWYNRQGDWDTAHQIVQNVPGADNAWVHAHLHREEGDLGNARFWYGRSGRAMSQASLAEEWEHIAGALLDKVPTPTP